MRERLVSVCSKSTLCGFELAEFVTRMNYVGYANAIDCGVDINTVLHECLKGLHVYFSFEISNSLV